MTSQGHQKPRHVLSGGPIAAEMGPSMVKGVEYSTYLQTTRWKLLRDEVLARDGYRCRVCNSRECLEVHHRTYERIGNEDFDDLTTLCCRCHDTFSRHGRLVK